MTERRAPGAWHTRLPEHDPPARIWTRILETRLSQERSRHRRRARYGAVAALLVAAVAVGLMLPSADRERELESMMSQARLLEERLLSYDHRAGRLDPVVQAAVAEQRTALMNIDHVLAQAYVEDRPEGEIRELWRQRLELLNAMIGVYESGSGIGASI